MWRSPSRREQAVQRHGSTRRPSLLMAEGRHQSSREGHSRHPTEVWTGPRGCGAYRKVEAGGLIDQAFIYTNPRLQTVCGKQVYFSVSKFYYYF